MNLELVGKDVHPSPELRQRIEQKLEKIESRLGRKLFVRVALGREANGYTCSVHFAANRHEFTANSAAEDLYKSADDALAKISRQVRKTMGHEGRHGHESIRTTIESEELIA